MPLTESETISGLGPCAARAIAPALLLSLISCPLAVVPSSKSTVNSEPINSWPEMPPTSQLCVAPESTPLVPLLAMPAIEFGSMSPEKPTTSPNWKPPETVGLNLTIAPLKPPLLSPPEPPELGIGFWPGRKYPLPVT